MSSLRRSATVMLPSSRASNSTRTPASGVRLSRCSPLVAGSQDVAESRQRSHDGYDARNDLCLHGPCSSPISSGGGELPLPTGTDDGDESHQRRGRPEDTTEQT